MTIQSPLRSPFRAVLRHPLGLADTPTPPASLLPGNVATASFQASPSTQPWYGGSTQYVAAHYNGKTYFVWQNYDRVNDCRYTSCRAYNHSTGQWGLVYAVGPKDERQDDDHGVGMICFNADGRAVIAYGAHDGPFHCAVMTNPEDESLWTTLNGGFVGEYTYPHGVLIGTTVYVLFREDIPAGVEFASGSKVLVYRPVTFSGATATIGAAVRIGDLGNNARWYQGNHILLGNGRVAQCCARADYNDTFRRNGYYYEIDFAGGQLVSINGTTAAFPVSGATMDSTFMVHDTTTGTPRDMGAPSLVIDDNARKHLLFTKGNGTANPDVMHMIAATTSFTAPVSIAQVTNGSDLADLPRAIRVGTSLHCYYNRDPDNLWGRGGNVYRKTLALGGGTGDWSAEELVMTADPARHALGQITDVFNAHANARIVFAEVAQDPLDASCFPSKRQFTLGDGGFINQTQPVGIAPTGAAFWIDPSDLGTLWSDVGRTAQTVVDGPIRVIDNKGTYGQFLTLEGIEPGILRFDDGVYWIDFGDEFSPTTSYALADVAIVVDNSYWACCVYRDHELTAGATVMMCLDDDTGGDRVFQMIKDTTTSGNLGGTIRVTGFGSPSANVTSSPLAPLRNNNDIVCGIHVNGPNVTGYYNGVQFGTGNATTNPPTGGARLRIGANAGLSSSSYLEGRFYGAIIRSGNVDLATRQQDMTYLRSRMPR